MPPAPARRRPPFLSSRALLAVLVPALAFETGIGAVTPMVAVRAGDLGADLATAGVLAALLGLGQLAGDLPAGALAARVGDRRAMLLAAAWSAVSLAGCALATDLVVLGACVLATGMANAVFLLARHSHLTEVTPVEYRARALSTLGGVGRIGVFVGPFLGAGVVHLSSTVGAFWLAVAITLLTAVLVALVPDVAPAGDAGPRPGRGRGAQVRLRVVVREHARLFASLGIAVLLVGAVRGSRQVLLPLWGEHLGLEASTIAVVYGLSGALDAAVFYPAGIVMDRRGRLAVGVPSMLAMAAAMLALPVATSLPTFAVLAALLGLGNGLSSGILMTLGADVAPAAVRSQFLGVWRLFQDAGTGGGPLLVSAGAALGSLAAGALSMGVVGLLATAALVLTVPRWSVHASRGTRVAAGLAPDGRPA
ncbi:MFS transporter [Cellulomonas endophytica]|uniref:MFS transporter n=1 Tax=Cellulomonas endophytica TaxID=2494735 RepID=UPI001013A2EE|nr:MFS transporter [Cellulomonas endophytica]